MFCSAEAVCDDSESWPFVPMIDDSRSMLNSFDSNSEEFWEFIDWIPRSRPSSPQPGNIREISFDADSGHGTTDTDSSTETLDEDCFRIVREHGREYPVVHGCVYPWPNDKKEIHRHHRQAQATKECLGKLIHGPVNNPELILDIGTGSGYWATELADAFPNARVYGIDEVLMQPNWTAPNCKFVIDVREGWRPARSYENANLVRVDRVFGETKSLASVLKGAYDCLAPGGVIEIHDLIVRPKVTNAETPFHQFYRDMKEAYQRDNRAWHLADAYQQILEDSGCRQLVCVVREIPLGAAPRGLKQEKVYQAWLDSFEASALRLFHTHLSKSYEQTMLDIDDARRSLRKEIEGSLAIEIVYGVKPDPMELPNTAIDESVSLHAAAAAGHVPTVRELLNCGHELNARNSRGQTPLSMAAKHGHLEVVKELLSQPGIDVNAVDLEHRTALYWAASRNRPQVLKVLLENEQIQPQIEMGGNST